MRILLINTTFPPTGGAGVQRIAKLAEFLIKNEQEVYAICCSNENKITDRSLMSKELRAVECLQLNGDNFILHEESEHYIAVIAFLKKIKPQVIISSSPLIQAHQLAMKLKEQFKFIWVADFRDFLSEYTSFFSPRYSSIKGKEKRIVESADIITVISDYHINYVINTFHISADKVISISNGYDPKDFLNDAVKHIINGNSSVQLMHVGSLYGSRTPLYLLIHSLIAQRRLKKRIELLFIGNMGRIPKLLCTFFSKAIDLQIIPYLPHDEAINKMKEADILVLIPGSFSSGVITGKVFEYLATNRPIINLYSFQGPLTKLLSSVEGTYNIHEYNNKKFCLSISEILNDNKLNRYYHREECRIYERDKQYLKLLDALTILKE